MENKTPQNTNPDEKPKRKRHKKSSALLAAAKGRSAVDQVVARSAQDVRGSNDIPNTGPTINYENES
jgi:hypothetical protein